MHQHTKLDDIRRDFEIAKWAFTHFQSLNARTGHLMLGSPDNTVSSIMPHGVPFGGLRTQPSVLGRAHASLYNRVKGNPAVERLGFVAALGALANRFGGLSQIHL